MPANLYNLHVYIAKLKRVIKTGERLGFLYRRERLGDRGEKGPEGEKEEKKTTKEE